MNITDAAFMVGHNQYGSRRVAKTFARLKGWAENAQEFDALIERVADKHGPHAIEQEILQGFRTIWVAQTAQPYAIVCRPDESPGVPDCRRVAAMVRVENLAAEVQRVETIANANARAGR